MAARGQFISNADHIRNKRNNFNVTHNLNVIPGHPKPKYNLLYININSLNGKLDDLELYINQWTGKRLNEAQCELHIIAVTDIQLHEDESKYYSIPYYKSYFTNNINGSGGAALFVHTSLPSGLVENDDAGNLNYLQVFIAGLKMNVAIIYMNPSTNSETLYRLFESIIESDQKLLLVGYYNMDFLQTTEHTKKYIDYVYHNNYSILNKLDVDYVTGQSIRTYRNNQIVVNSIKDIMISNLKGFKYNLSYINAPFTRNKVMLLGFDDHRRHDFNLTEPNFIEYEKTNLDQYEINFLEINWHHPFPIDQLLVLFRNCRDMSTATVRRNRYNPQRRGILYHNEETYLRTRGVAYVRNIQRNRFEPKWLMDTINGIITNQPSIRQPIKALRGVDGAITMEKPQIANIFNNFFINIGKDLSNQIENVNINTLPKPDLNINELGIISTTANEVRWKIHTLKKNNSRSEYIPSDILKKYNGAVAQQLTPQLNQCFRSGTYPNLLKISRVVPVFKGKDPLDPANYRPISVQQNISKIMEMIIYDHIAKFCQDNQIIHPHQYGFQKDSSGECAVVRVLNQLYTGLNLHTNRNSKNAFGACVFFDLKKASETIPHDLLLFKLYRIGIRNQSLDLLKDYLRDRRQFVDIDGTYGTLNQNSNGIGIPQGSILGPYLLSIYINDIFKLQLRGKITLFGDDVNMVYVESNKTILKLKIRYDMKKLYEYFSGYKLTMNTSKTKIMIVNQNPNINTDMDIEFRGESIEFVDSHKFLGIILQSNLKWDMQIAKLGRELLGISNATRRIGNGLDIRMLKTIYQNTVHNSLMRFAAILGTYGTQNDVYRLQLRQDDAVRSIFLYVDRHINQIYDDYELLRVREVFDYGLAFLFYKLKSLRIRIDSSIFQHNLTDDSLSVVSAGNNIFNSLPEPIRIQRSINAFRNALKNYLVQMR